MAAWGPPLLSGHTAPRPGPHTAPWAAHTEQVSPTERKELPLVVHLSAGLGRTADEREGNWQREQQKPRRPPGLQG